jgi:hypothetical protein
LNDCPQLIRASKVKAVVIPPVPPIRPGELVAVRIVGVGDAVGGIGGIGGIQAVDDWRWGLCPQTPKRRRIKPKP